MRKDLFMLNEFKQFAIKGNVIDLAVGVIIGTAFGKIVSSIVNDIVMPPLGLLISGIDFSALAITLKEATEAEEAVSINYGLFINHLIEFLIIAFVIFLLIKQLNRFKREEAAKPAVTPEEIVLLREIRDNLKR